MWHKPHIQWYTMIQAEQVSRILSSLNRSADCTYASTRWLHSTHRDLAPLLSKACKPIISTSTDITSSPPNQLSLENTPNSKMLSIALWEFFLAALSVIVAARNPLGQSTPPHQQSVGRGLIFGSSCRWPARLRNRRALGRNQHNCMRLGRNCPVLQRELPR